METLLSTGHAMAVVLVSGVLEGFAVPWPSPLVLAWAGAGARGAVAHLGLATLYAAGYVAGALGQYGLGRLFGPVLLRLLPPPQAERVLNLIARWGQPAVLWSRPLMVGNFVSIPAALVRMPVGRFVLYTWLGIWPWALAVLAGGGWLVDKAGALTPLMRLYRAVDAWLEPALWVAAAGAAAWFAWRLRQTLRRNGRKEKGGRLPAPMSGP